MKRLEQLPEMTDDMLGGLHATQDLKKEILRDAKAAMQDGKAHYRNSAWESKKVNANTRRQRSVLQRSLAMACMLVVLLGSVVGFPTLIGLDVKNKQGIVTTQMGAENLNNAQSQALDLPQGSIVISQRSAPSYRGIWAAASGANFPLICVEGRYYRLLTNPTSIGGDLLGKELGAVSTYTSEPALASGGVISNTVAEGGKVYAVSGMNGAMVAAEVDGKMRVFQRVAFGGNALVGGEKLGDTLKASKVVAMELTDVGTVTDAKKAKELYEILISNASLSRSGASETGASLLIQLENGLALQLAVRDESVMACGTWTCPEFFEAFEAAEK